MGISEQTRKKLRQANLGKKLSEETKKKISLTLKGRIPKNIFREGNTPWNKGLKGWNKGKIISEEAKKKMSLAKIGKYRGKNHPNWKGGFPKCPVCKKILSSRKAMACVKHRQNNIGKNKYNWKGDNVKYGTLHDWVSLHKGKAKICEYCNNTKNIQWANKSHEYKRDLTDWLSLCVSCHRKYDKNYEGGKLK